MSDLMQPLFLSKSFLKRQSCRRTTTYSQYKMKKFSRDQAKKKVENIPPLNHTYYIVPGKFPEEPTHP